MVTGVRRCSSMVGDRAWSWPVDAFELRQLQSRLGAAAATALAAESWSPSDEGNLVGGCFIATRRRTAGAGRQGDPVWAAAVVWQRPAARVKVARRSDRHLAGAAAGGPPRRADDVLAQAVVTGRAPAPYRPGLLAARDGALLAEALASLDVRPDVVLVDATGLDHPRHAGLAVHLGAATGLPTVGVTRNPLLAAGSLPELRRGACSQLLLDGLPVAYWVCTRDGAQPLVAHAGWRTSPETAVRVVLQASTPAARTPVPLQEARRVAREARSVAEEAGEGG